MARAAAGLGEVTEAEAEESAEERSSCCSAPMAARATSCDLAEEVRLSSQKPSSPCHAW